MGRIFQIAGMGVLLSLSLFSQDPQPVPAPGDVILYFNTDGDQHQFHLGELIPVKYSYSAETSGKYVLVGFAQIDLTGGRGLEISCSRLAEPLSSSPPWSQATMFEKMLKPCLPGFFTCGGASGGVDWESPLGPVPVNFGPVPFNGYVPIRKPGTYTCTASSADVTADPPKEKARTALLVTSKPVVLTIVDDPEWSRSISSALATAYDKICTGDDASQSQCSDIAKRITYLDTRDSLAAEVKFFDGRDHGWDNGFWAAIETTSYPNEAARLMTNRIQDPDVTVSPGVLESLAIWDLRIDSPDAFETDQPANYHALAVEKLRKYVRLLGASLSRKNSEVLTESSNTYRAFAEQKYCEEQSLIPQEEQNQVLAALATPQ